MYFILRKVSRYGLRLSQGVWHSILGEEGRGRLDPLWGWRKIANIGWLERGYGIRSIWGFNIGYDRAGVVISGARRYTAVLFVWAWQIQLSIAVKQA